MKKTLFNASLEESMNLVTDKYIELSLKESKHKKILKKLVGGLFIIFIMCLSLVLGNYLNEKNITFFFLNIQFCMLILLLAGIIIYLFYFLSIFTIKNKSILSYYYYMRSFSLLAVLFCFQGLILTISGTAIVLGNIWSAVLYGLVCLLVFLERYLTIKKETFGKLYCNKTTENKLMTFLENLTTFSKRYGSGIILIIILLRTIMSNALTSNFMRTIGLLISPVIFFIILYFGLALVVDTLQGYYLQKYLEDYRQLSGCSVEEWYGKKSKMYKESLKNK